jgi:superfamily II DNA/RNA helicase
MDLTSQSRVDLIVQAIEDAVKDSRMGTMVFVNTAEAASTLTSNLRRQGLSCAEFHKLVPFTEKIQELHLFRTGEVPILVCTDHAARGLDLPRVFHVIQAEFALNVVNHLHRIGRASRAGSFGVATNLFGRSSKDLVESILLDEEGGRIDQSFSRRRGFRQKIKKEIKRSGERNQGEEE